MNYVILLAVLNFISILILFSCIMYVYDLEVRNKYDIELVKDYQRANESQLKNLITDINKNDNVLKEILEKIYL